MLVMQKCGRVLYKMTIDVNQRKKEYDEFVKEDRLKQNERTQKAVAEIHDKLHDIRSQLGEIEEDFNRKVGYIEGDFLFFVSQVASDSLRNAKSSIHDAIQNFDKLGQVSEKQTRELNK